MLSLPVSVAGNPAMCMPPPRARGPRASIPKNSATAHSKPATLPRRDDVLFVQDARRPAGAMTTTLRVSGQTTQTSGVPASSHAWSSCQHALALRRPARTIAHRRQTRKRDHQWLRHSLASRRSGTRPQEQEPPGLQALRRRQKVEGKTMAEHFRFSVAYWHAFRNGCATSSAGPRG